MNRLFLDTNILLDFLINKRLSQFPETKVLFNKAYYNELQLFCSSVSMVNVLYILRTSIKEDSARKSISTLRTLVNVLSVDEKVIDAAVNSRFKDFEDAVQYHCALKNDIHLILSRNQKDFKHSALPIMDVRAFLGLTEENG